MSSRQCTVISIIYFISAFAVTGPLEEKQIAYVSRETLQVSICSVIELM